MSSLSAFLAGAWDFVVGDDWRTPLLAHAGVQAWWVMPPAVIALLALSIRRAARGSQAAARTEADTG